MNLEEYSEAIGGFIGNQNAKFMAFVAAMLDRPASPEWKLDVIRMRLEADKNKLDDFLDALGTADEISVGLGELIASRLAPGEALKISRGILAQAEEERIAVAEQEAARGIQYKEERE